ncbi:hypothetical protein CBL_20676, partial [Carabus blaptoides fortunei]
ALRTPTYICETVRKWNLSFDRKTDPVAFLERLEELQTSYKLTDEQLLIAIPELLKATALLWCRNNHKTWNTIQDLAREIEAYERLQKELKHHHATNIATVSSIKKSGTTSPPNTSYDRKGTCWRCGETDGKRRPDRRVTEPRPSVPPRLRVAEQEHSLLFTTEKTPDERMMIPIMVAGIPTSALIDTGSARSYINQDLMNPPHVSINLPTQPLYEVTTTPEGTATTSNRLTSFLNEELPLFRSVKEVTPLITHHIRLKDPTPIKQRYQPRNPKMMASINQENLQRKKELSPKLQTSWDGTHKVIKRLNDVVYRIQPCAQRRCKKRVVHLERLAPYGSKGIVSDRDDQT